MKIIPLSEGAFTVDATKTFVPFNKEAEELQQRPAGSLLVEIQPFAIVTSKDIIVIDTGLGFADANGILQIHKNLMDNAINPAEVTKVLLSHLHKDHSGGMYNEDKVLHQKFFSFPNATYFINKNELDFALQKGKPSYTTYGFDLLTRSDKVHFLHDNGKIGDEITYHVTGAHCPFHQVFWIEEEGQKIFFGGDVAPQLLQMKNRFIAKYDFDGRKSMELRQQWWLQGMEEKWTFLFYHDLKTPVFNF